MRAIPPTRRSGTPISRASSGRFYGTFTLSGGKVAVVDVADLSASKQNHRRGNGPLRRSTRRVKETRVAEGRTRDVFTIIS
jgi:hypothetical protein